MENVVTTNAPLRREITVVVKDKTGFHTRTAALFAKQAAAFECAVRVLGPNGKEANGKSMLGLMSLGVKSNVPIVIAAEGADADEAAASLGKLVESHFGAAS